MTVEDFLMRRTRLYLLDSRQGVEAAAEVAGLMAGWLARSAGWTEADRDAWAQRETERFRQAVRLGKPPRDTAA
ncbi:hypothetical protein D3C72_2226980 [compost metagenome]